jgi:hypothetical protein
VVSYHCLLHADSPPVGLGSLEDGLTEGAVGGFEDEVHPARIGHHPIESQQLGQLHLAEEGVHLDGFNQLPLSLLFSHPLLTDCPDCHQHARLPVPRQHVLEVTALCHSCQHLEVPQTRLSGSREGQRGNVLENRLHLRILLGLVVADGASVGRVTEAGHLHISTDPPPSLTSLYSSLTGLYRKSTALFH